MGSEHGSLLTVFLVGHPDRTAFLCPGFLHYQQFWTDPFWFIRWHNYTRKGHSNGMVIIIWVGPGDPFIRFLYIAEKNYHWMQDLSMGCVTEVVNSEEKLYRGTVNFGDSGESHIIDWIAVWVVFYHAFSLLCNTQTSEEPFCGASKSCRKIG